MATAPPLLITAEEFARMPPPPDGSKMELVRGEVETVCRPGFRHGRICAILDAWGRGNNHGRAVVETGVVTVRDPDTVRGPDVSYWSAAKVPLDEEPDGYPEPAPDLSVEVLSPNHRLAHVRTKLAEYFRRGVRMVWVVDPEDRTVSVYRSPYEGRIFHESATISGDDVLPGFSILVRDLLA